MDKLSASEALYGFIGWVTTREEVVVASAKHNAAKWADLVAIFIKENKLKEPTDRWETNLIHPSSDDIKTQKGK